MELNDERVIDKMLKQQEKDNEEILNQPILRLIEDVPLVKPETISNVSCTHIKRLGDTMQLCRFIDSKLYKVEFTLCVKLCDVEQYFELDNDTFKKLGVRELLI